MTKSLIYRENGELKINFTLNTNCSMLQLEEQIEHLIKSAEEKLSEVEKAQVTKEILQAFNNAKI
jgi:hypothetical protein